MIAFNGVGPFQSAMRNRRAIGSLPQDDQMVWAVPSSSEITSVEQMADKPTRRAIPGKDYPLRFLVETILNLYGTSLDYLLSRGWSIIEDSKCLTVQANVDRDVPCVDFSGWLLFVTKELPFDVAYALTKICVKKKRELFEIHYENKPPDCRLIIPIDPNRLWKNGGLTSLSG